MNISSDLEEAMTEVRQKLILQKIKSSVIEKYSNLHVTKQMRNIHRFTDNSYFPEPTELKDLIDTNNIVQQFLPKQTDIDKILEIIRKKNT